MSGLPGIYSTAYTRRLADLEARIGDALERTPTRHLLDTGAMAMTLDRVPGLTDGERRRVLALIERAIDDSGWANWDRLSDAERRWLHAALTGGKRR